ncbi:hypothetical protein [Pseudomonas donghuensis]|uniref:hypothetical protein n=1 Tax=Pseudomonas donghuensis TaxID=1163398 RepID=UPI00029B3B81|nr:hypothetical protein [Pseudomonas donghuensis]
MSALIVTQDDVECIKTYVETGQALPQTEELVKKELPEGSEGFVGEFTRKYREIKAHTNTWTNVKTTMTDVSNELIAFARDMSEFCNGIPSQGVEGAISIIKGLDGYAKGGFDSLTDEQLLALPDISFENDDVFNPDEVGDADEAKVATLDEIVEYIKTSIENKKQSTNSALGTLVAFENKIGPIKTWVGEKVKNFSNNGRDQAIFDKFTALIKFDAELKIENALAKQEMGVTVKNVLLVLSGPLGIMALLDKHEKIQGVAEANRKKRKDMLLALKQASKIRGEVAALHVSLGSLFDVVNNAKEGLVHLHSHWDAVKQLVDGSVDNFKSKKNYATLAKFVGKLTLVMEDWDKIKKHSTALKEAFRLAYDE